MRKTLSLLLALIMVLALCPVFATAEVVYTEAPALADKVANGELPPVAERLPSNPDVLEVPEVGVYGGTWRQAVTSGTFNHAHAHVTGYLDQNALVWNRDKTEIVPSWLSAYEANADMTEFTFTLRDGLKWSDGAPVTTADVEFWFNDLICNTDLSPTNNYYGDCTLTVVDELTWKFTFEAAKPLYITWWSSDGNSRFVLPSHYLKQFHAAYAEDIEAVAADEGFDDWVLMFEDKINHQKNMYLPTLGPWVLACDPAETNTVIFERNPYYWAVDQNGQQLPYIDEAVISIVESTDLVNMKVIGGEVDVQVACVQESFSNYPLFAQYAEEMGYSIRVSDFNEPNAMNIHFNATNVDPVKSQVLGSVEFRKAMSIGFDRETIIATFYSVGPYSALVAQSSPLEGSPYYDENLAKSDTEFDPDKANQMLDELGMTTYDENGWRCAPSGDPLDLVIMCPNYDSQWIEVMEMLASQWRENLKVNVTAQQVDPSLWGERCAANDFDITNMTGSNGLLLNNESAISAWTGYSGNGWGVRFMSGVYLDEGEYAFPADENMARIRAIGEELRVAIDPEVTKALWLELTTIYAEQRYSIGIGRRLPAINIVKNNVKNVGLLDQDWGFGFCGFSRPEGYWFAE